MCSTICDVNNFSFFKTGIKQVTCLWIAQYFTGLCFNLFKWAVASCFVKFVYDFIIKLLCYVFVINIVHQSSEFRRVFPCNFKHDWNWMKSGIHFLLVHFRLLQCWCEMWACSCNFKQNYLEFIFVILLVK